MSKGTQVKGVRIPADLQAEIQLTIERRNMHTRREPWEFTAFILTAVREKIAKMERCRYGKRRIPARSSGFLSSATPVENANAVS